MRFAPVHRSILDRWLHAFVQVQSIRGPQEIPHSVAAGRFLMICCDGVYLARVSNESNGALTMHRQRKLSVRPNSIPAPAQEVFAFFFNLFALLSNVLQFFEDLLGFGN